MLTLLPQGGEAHTNSVPFLSCFPHVFPSEQPPSMCQLHPNPWVMFCF